MTKAERKEARLRKGKQWLLTYTGSPKKMNKHYRLNGLKNSGSGSGEWSGKRKRGNGWQNCMRTAMIVLLLSPDIQMEAHRMV
ncbi:Uncharacterised protein [uncultured Clostridium sp.]|nr:Uncharacterised protein [uncultured Clostridium sp.]